MADIYLERRLFPNGRQSHINLDNSFNLTRYLNTIIPSSTNLDFENGLTETGPTVRLGGILTQATTAIDGVAGQTRRLDIGGTTPITVFNLVTSADIEMSGENVTSSGTTAVTLINSNSNAQVAVVATASSTSGVRVRTANVHGTTAAAGQVLNLVNATTGEVEYVSRKYSQNFADTDFSTQTLTIPAATHGMGTDLNINVYSGASGAVRTALYPAAGTALVSITIAANGDVTLTSTSGSEFTGLIVIS